MADDAELYVRAVEDGAEHNGGASTRTRCFTRPLWGCRILRSLAGVCTPHPFCSAASAGTRRPPGHHGKSWNPLRHMSASRLAALRQQCRRLTSASATAARRTWPRLLVIDPLEGENWRMVEERPRTSWRTMDGGAATHTTAGLTAYGSGRAGPGRMFLTLLEIERERVMAPSRRAGPLRGIRRTTPSGGPPAGPMRRAPAQGRRGGPGRRTTCRICGGSLDGAAAASAGLLPRCGPPGRKGRRSSHPGWTRRAFPFGRLASNAVEGFERPGRPQSCWRRDSLGRPQSY